MMNWLRRRIGVIRDCPRMSSRLGHRARTENNLAAAGGLRSSSLMTSSSLRRGGVALSRGLLTFRPGLRRGPPFLPRVSAMVKHLGKAPPAGASILMTDGEFENFWNLLDARRRVDSQPAERRPPSCGAVWPKMGAEVAAFRPPAAQAAHARAPSKPYHRCGTCRGCTSTDCGLCKNCRDKPRYAFRCPSAARVCPARRPWVGEGAGASWPLYTSAAPPPADLALCPADDLGLWARLPPPTHVGRSPPASSSSPPPLPRTPLPSTRDVPATDNHDAPEPA